MILIEGTGGEVKSRGWTAGSAIAECQRPQSIKLQRQVVDIKKASDEYASGDVVSGNRTIAEVPDQEGVREPAKIGRRLHDAPGSVQVDIMRQAQGEVTRGVVDVDITEALNWGRRRAWQHPAWHR